MTDEDLAPSTVVDHPIDDGPLEWSRARRSLTRFVANIVAAGALLAIAAMFGAYVMAGTP